MTAGPGRRATLVGALWNVAAMIVPLVSTLLLSIVIARQLGSDELGAQSLIAYVGSLVTSVVIFAATNCTTQVMASAHGADDRGRLLTLGRWSGLVHVVGGALAGLALASVGAVRDHPLAWVFIGLVIFIDAVGWSYGSRLVAHHGWRAVSPLRLVSQIVASLLGVAAVFLGLGIAGVFGVQVLSSVWLTLTLRRRDRREPADDGISPAPVELRPLLRLWGLFVLAAGLSQIVDKRVELLFLDGFRSPHEVAVYSVAFSLATVAVTVPIALMGALVPGIAAAAASENAGALREHMHRASRLSTLSGFLLTAGLAGVGGAAVIAFWGSGLQESAGIMPWIALSVLFVPLPTLCNSYWTGVGRLTPVLVATAIGAVADLVAAAALVPSLGVPGAVAANIAAQVVTCALLVGYTRRHLPAVTPRGLFLLRCGAVSVPAGVAAWAVSSALLQPVGAWPALLAGAVAFLLVLGVTGVAVGLVPVEDAVWLAATLPAAARPLLFALSGPPRAVRRYRAEHPPAVVPRRSGDGSPRTDPHERDAGTRPLPR